MLKACNLLLEIILSKVSKIPLHIIFPGLFSTMEYTIKPCKNVFMRLHTKYKTVYLYFYNLTKDSGGTLFFLMYTQAYSLPELSKDGIQNSKY